MAEVRMRSDMEKESWTVDQLTKSQFFHQKLHEWGILEIAYELENIKGEHFDWDLGNLRITTKAWDRVIHKGVKPVRVFAHPEVLKQNPERIGYYRMLAMVSQKSMARVGLSVNRYERGQGDLDNDTALEISGHLNRIVSILIENDEDIDDREFDLWRGMAAGSQAQGSWGNTKGDRAEVVIKDLVERRVKERGSVLGETSHGKSKALELNDGRILILGTEPDIGVYKGDTLIQIAIEIKGGIDPAAVLERFGASLKSLRRAKQENGDSVTILIMQGVSLTSRVREEIKNSRNTIDHFFTIEDIIGSYDDRKHFFTIMEI
jgi:hypothetical protein